MRFRKNLGEDAPEINLIPLIDVLLVVLIFLAVSTSFTRTAQLQLSLPAARAEPAATPQALTLAISADGHYAVDGHWLAGTALDDIAQALQLALRDRGEGSNRRGSSDDPALVISADTHSAHGSVVLALQAARAAGIARVSFATQGQP